jgi:DNA-directed RNA polymerase subunit K/omega
MAKEQSVKYTKYERARLIGSRALQISHGAPLLIKLKEKELEDLKYNPIAIAKREFEEGVIPLEILRK